MVCDLTLPVSIDLHGSMHEHLINYYDLFTIIIPSNLLEVNFFIFVLVFGFHYY